MFLFKKTNLPLYFDIVLKASVMLCNVNKDLYWLCIFLFYTSFETLKSFCEVGFTTCWSGKCKLPRNFLKYTICCTVKRKHAKTNGVFVLRKSVFTKTSVLDFHHIFVPGISFMRDRYNIALIKDKNEQYFMKSLKAIDIHPTIQDRNKKESKKPELS